MADRVDFSDDRKVGVSAAQTDDRRRHLSDLHGMARRLRFDTMRNSVTIDSELRLRAAVRRSNSQGSTAPFCVQAEHRINSPLAGMHLAFQ